ncbi:MAG: prohibitin family protein [Lachnospiraceae bacterium]|nr:prohibitin family protein [Lachnospiraceae bacterium]
MVKIPVGYAGVIYSMNGGVKDNTLSQGYHITKPTEHVKCFTTSNEQLLLTKDEREGSKDDDSFKVSTSDDASIAISFQMSYKFNEAQLVDTYKKFRGMDGEDIVNSRVKSVLKSKVSEITTDYSMMDIYSGNRSEINSKLTDYLDSKFIEEYGINVLDASIIDVHPDDQLKEAINNRVTALQKKQQAQAEQETAKVEAETALIKAENAAAIKVKEAEAEAEANRLKAASITRELISMKEAEARLKHGWVTVQSGGTVAVTD